MTAEAHARLDEFFGGEIGPHLAQLEAERRKALRRCGVALLALLVVLALLSLGDAVDLALLGAVAIALAAGACWLFLREYRNAVRRHVAPAVCRAIGDLQHAVGGRVPLWALRDARLIAPWSKEEVDDVFEGIWRDTLFMMAEVKLTTVKGSGKNSRTSTVFKGLLFFIETPRPIASRIVMRGRRRWLLTPWRPKRRELTGLRRVAIPHPAFNRRLQLWSNHPDDALEVVTPGFADAMAHLASTAGWRGLDAAFEKPNLAIALPRRGDLFRVGSLFRPASQLGRDAHRLLDEVLTVHRLIDLLHGGPARAAA